MFQRRGFGKFRWLIMAVLTAFIVVQLSPYGAAATVFSQPAIAPDASKAALSTSPSLQPSPNPLLAELQDLPNGAAALPNFDPGVNGFQFSNQELIQAIDLERNAIAWEEVLTEQLQRLFGTQVCIGQEGGVCLLTSAAKDWLNTQLERMNQGLSEGMTAAVLSLWQPEQPPRIPWWQRLINFLVGRVVFGLARTLFDLQTFIANLFLTQGVAEVFQQTQAIRDTLTPTQILLSVVDIFLSGSSDPFTMGIYQVIEGVLTGGHSLTPYQIEEQDDGKYWVYVYDSNYPAGRAASPTDLHVEFDTVADTWSYQPTPDAPVFKGNAQSKNLDLTQLSWRQPETPEDPAFRGPFTCPFCNIDPAAEAPVEPTIDVTLIGEGKLTVTPYGADAPTSQLAEAQVALVPFKGGLNREVPASYRLPADSLDKPLKITLEGTPTAQLRPYTLQLTGPGYTADFEGTPLTPDEILTMYVVPHTTGPELTFVSNQAVEIPQLSIHLTDDTTAYPFDSSTPEGFSLTERQVSKSSGFELSGLKLPAGKRVALSAREDLKRLYFADDDLANSQYGLKVRNRIVIKDRVQIGERQPDFLNYTVTYEEEMQASNVQVDGQTQAFFNYDPAFVTPAEKSRQELLETLEQRDFPITIAYEPLSISTGETPGPMGLAPSEGVPMAERVFQGSLRKSANK
ncbi:MAG: hypothetical protein F6J95_021430 [Leptolyngbya sp. SIO1E4]|nr:hypothetical protein [Leptolyngbya sp. SIO1E4]